MTAHNFARDRGGIPTSSQRGFDPTSAHLSLQPAINEPFAGLYSPLGHEHFGQSVEASPPQLPSIQLGGQHRQRAFYSDPANMLSTNPASLPLNYETPVSSTADLFQRSMSFGNASMHGYSTSIGGATENSG
jgi:hypothetical protein